MPGLILPIVTLVCAFTILGTPSALPQSPVIYTSNYDVLLHVGDATRQIRSRAKVCSGHVIPLDFQNHRIDLRVAEISSEKYSVEIAIFELSQGDWYQLNTENLTFEGQLGIPTQFSWESGELALDLAMVVGLMRQ